MNIAVLPDALRSDLDRLSTVSDKIRLLDRNGYERADIARILGKRYQHVRNVLEADRRKAAAKDSTAQAAATALDTDTVMRFQVAPDGTMRLPPEVLAALEIPAGGTLSGRLENGQLVLVEPTVALRRVQEALRPLRDKLRVEGRSLVDELIAERREETRRDAGD